MGLERDLYKHKTKEVELLLFTNFFNYEVKQVFYAGIVRTGFRGM